MTDADDDYLAREAKARKNIDKQLVAAGWIVQKANEASVSAGAGVAIRELVLEKGHGRVDYLLFLNGQPAGVIEAKPEGTTLVEVEHQSGKYVDGLPDWITPTVYPLSFIYESTGAETRFTNGLKLVGYGNKDPGVASTIAGRLARLDKRFTKDDRETLTALAGRTDLGTITHRIGEALAAALGSSLTI